VFPLHDVIDAAPCNLHDTEWSSAPTAFCAAASETRSQNADRRFSDFWLLISAFWSPATPGGARRDRTDDLMLAKHALSQLSYGPAPEAQKSESQKSEARTQTFWLLISGFWLLAAGGGWWAWEDLNLRPHAYQARALTN
jgi:hypothetical protein